MNLFTSLIRRLGGKPTYSPRYNPVMDRAAAVATAAELWSLSSSQAESLWKQHEAFVEKQGYGDEITAGKTLSLDESFFVYVLMARRRPRTIVEIGTQYGRSTRRIIDMGKALGLDPRVVCYDIADEVKYFDKRREAELRVCDITSHFRTEVMEGLKPDFVFLDARPRPLIEAVVSGVMASPGSSLLAIHDCARGICRRDAADMPLISPTSMTGVWERHVLATAFGVADPLSPQLDSCDRFGLRLRIPPTRHGLALLGRESCFASLGSDA